MNVQATTAVALARLGVLDLVSTYGNDRPNEWKGLVGRELNSRKQLYETIIQDSGVSPAQEYVDGNNISFDTITTPFEKKFYPVQYQKSFQWSVKAGYNDLYGIYTGVGSKLAKAHYDAKETVAASIMNNATSGSYTGIDGVALASASHPTESGLWSNISTAAALSAGSLETMVQDVMVHPAYRTGVFADVDGPWVLNVPPALAMLAQRILATNLQPGTANNDKNVVAGYISRVQVNRRFTSTTAYILVPAKDNPIFCLYGMPFTDFGGVKFWQDPPSYKLVTMQEYVFGWTKAQGIQYNAGA